MTVEQTPAMAMFGEVMESSRNLPKASSDIGRIMLSLTEIGKRAQKLREAYHDDNATKAHYLLAGSGINAEDITAELQSIVIMPEKRVNGGPVTRSVGVSDVSKYLGVKREENILATIEEAAANKSREFAEFLAQNVTLDWNTRKQEICQHFGLTGPSAPAVGETSAVGAGGFVAPRTTAGPKRQLSTSFEGTGVTRTKRQWGRASLGQLVLGGEFTDVRRADIGGNQSRARKYAKVIREFTEHRLDGKAYAIASALSAATMESAALAGNVVDMKTQQMLDNWKILTYLTQEQGKKPVQERKYARAYLKSGVSQAESSQLRQQILSGSKQYLEHQFYRLIESEVARHPHEAQTGGVPSVYAKVRGYLNLKFWRNGKWSKDNLEIVNNVPVWALLYYMIRSGHYQEALEFTLEREAAFMTIERSFPAYLRAYVQSTDHELPRDMLERLHTEFHQHIQYVGATSDPYKYALYKLIGRCDLSRKAFPEIVSTTEDWLWVHLMLARESSGGSSSASGAVTIGALSSAAASSAVGTVSTPQSKRNSVASLRESLTPRTPLGSFNNGNSVNLMHEQYGLVDLQNTVIRFGAKHFTGQGSNPGIYLQVLLLCGLFEHAVQYAYSFSTVDAVHFAIALTYYGLLRPLADVRPDTCELLVVDGNDIPHIDFAQLIGQYTRDFRRSDPCDAVDYLLLIGLNRDVSECGARQLDLCREALTELVLETREFSRLLGDVRRDGTRAPGAIEMRGPLLFVSDEQEYLHVITLRAAKTATDTGRTADAVLLYQLAEKYDRVISLINKSLGEALSIGELGKPISPQVVTGPSGDISVINVDGNTSFSGISGNISTGGSPPALLSAIDDPALLARSMMQLYTTNPAILSKVSQQNRESCRILLQMIDARDAFARGNWEQALHDAETTNVIAIGPDAKIGEVRERAQEFAALDEAVARNIPALLVMVMHCLVRIGQALGDSLYATAGRQSKRSELERRGRTCMMYAGMIQYRMPREVYNQITRLEMLI